MIVKIIILRLLGSSDDKEREDRRSKTRRAAPTGVRGGAAPRGSQGSVLKALRIRSTGRSDAMASEHPVVVGRTDAMMFGVGWNRSQVSF